MSQVGASQADIVALLGQGLSNTAIASQLGCDRHRVAVIRRAQGLPDVVAQPLTLEQKWSALTRALDGGHLEWCGEKVGPSESPVMRYKGRSYSPTKIAFTIQHGRPPEGQVKPECGMRHCVAPTHVEDQPGRTRLRDQLWLLRGGHARQTHCRRGHDQSVHGRNLPDGYPYCGACHQRAPEADPNEPQGAPCPS
ncbi:hypothetical protein ACFZC3_15240 [Streptomyces sp. NPDC007903]|uniref:hypothetical protein n=1 Tax=Streptomyces sp. NPDC007903 TaxID=3364786 RepID=UPI0036E15852